MLGTNLYGLQLRDAPGILEGFDGIFGRESAHNQCQLTVGCHMDGSRINSLNIFRGPSTTSIHFHKKCDVFHNLMSLAELWGNVSETAVHFFEVEYTTSVKGLPHSKQLGFNRDVINPQDGHILCN
jgi:hypothetical protein